MGCEPAWAELHVLSLEDDALTLKVLEALDRDDLDAAERYSAGWLAAKRRQKQLLAELHRQRIPKNDTDR